MKNDVCFSGGAIGSDFEWGKLAIEHGHDLKHFSFDGHHRIRGIEEYYIDVPDHFLFAPPVNDAVKRTAKNLGRKIPTDSYVTRLIRRNYFQVFMTDSVYAVSSFKEYQDVLGNEFEGKLATGVLGGTAWAIDMFLMRFIKSSVVGFLPVYIFDTKTQLWFQNFNVRWMGNNRYETKFIAINPTEKIDKPSGNWTGIGTRKITKEAKLAMAELFETKEINYG